MSAPLYSNYCVMPVRPLSLDLFTFKILKKTNAHPSVISAELCQVVRPALQTKSPRVSYNQGIRSTGSQALSMARNKFQWLRKREGRRRRGRVIREKRGWRKRKRKEYLRRRRRRKYLEALSKHSRTTLRPYSLLPIRIPALQPAAEAKNVLN